jgi:hypothetical protein
MSGEYELAVADTAGLDRVLLADIPAASAKKKRAEKADAPASDASTAEAGGAPAKDAPAGPEESDDA